MGPILYRPKSIHFMVKANYWVQELWGLYIYVYVYVYVYIERELKRERLSWSIPIPFMFQTKWAQAKMDMQICEWAQAG